MATATPASSSPSTPEPASEASTLTSRPLLWLLAILILALGLRAWKMNDPLQRDEFSAVYTVVERKTASPDEPPSSATPLKPVDGLGEVSARSVLPFGVRNPIPIYHDIVYLFVSVLPIAEWSLRLPSLLAGLGCVVGVYYLCRRLIGVEMGLIAALFVAVEPTQVLTSVLARPYALGNLACVLSFLGLLGALSARNTGQSVLAALGYAAAVAFIGYMNPILLLVVFAHIGMVVYWLVVHKGAGIKAALVVGGLAVGAVLMVPEYGYFNKLHAFASAHREQMRHAFPTKLLAFFQHNATFLAGLLVAWVAAYVVRQQMQGSEEENVEEGQGGAAPAGDAPKPAPVSGAAPVPVSGATTAVAEVAAPEVASPEPLPADNPDAIWVGRLWIFLPQLVAFVLAYAAGEGIFYTRYLSYTTLGGLVILAYYTTREQTRDIRLGVSAAVAVALFLMGLTPWGHGERLQTPAAAHLAVTDLNAVPDQSWQTNDVILFRSGMVESDFAASEFSEESRQQLSRALAAPLTTLYVPRHPARIIVLSNSQNNKEGVGVGAKETFNPDPLYNADMGRRLRASEHQFWVVDEFGLDAPQEFGQYLTCLLPWLADQVGWDLKVARNRDRNSPDRYFTVQTDWRPHDFVDGLTNGQKDDFKTRVVRVQRLNPRRLRVVTNIGALGATPLDANPVTVTAAAWLLTQDRTPRLASPPPETTPPADQPKP
jgi:hypothetical protein